MTNPMMVIEEPSIKTRKEKISGWYADVFPLVAA